MSKIISRAELRGNRIDRDCIEIAKPTKEFPDDNRRFCTGIVDASTEALLPKCKICKAHWEYAEPISKEAEQE